MNDNSRKTHKDRSGLFLGTILVALVVMVFALTLAAAHSFAGRMPLRVNHAVKSWHRPMPKQQLPCVTSQSYRMVAGDCGTKLSADH